MNAFEEVVAYYLEEQGCWVKRSVKVNISKEDKKEIGLYSMPRPEIDLVALRVREKELMLVEAKSYLDSPGVRYADVTGENSKGAKRYRLFTDDRYREIVTRRIIEEFLLKGLIGKETRINYALAAGNTYSDDERKIRAYFTEKGWIFISPMEIKETIRNLATRGWEDNLITITAKLVSKK